MEIQAIKNSVYVHLVFYLFDENMDLIFYDLIFINAHFLHYKPQISCDSEAFHSN